MRKKRLMGITTLVTVLVLTAVGFKLVNMKQGQEKSTTESSEEATPGDGLTDDKTTSDGNDTDDKTTEDVVQEAKNSEDEYWEWHFEAEQNDIETAQAGTIYNLDEIEDITYGGATFNIKNVIYIPDRDMIPELVPGYDDYNMYLSEPERVRYKIDGEMEDYELMLWCVEFDITNNSNHDIEAFWGNADVFLTDTDGRKIMFSEESIESFYSSGNDETIHTHRESFVNLAPGETRHMVAGIYLRYLDITGYLAPDFNDDYVFDYYIKLSPLVGGAGDGTTVEYIQDDTRYVYIKCGTGSINSLSEKYKDDEGE